MCSSPGCLSARTLVTITLHTSIRSQRSIYLYLHTQDRQTDSDWQQTDQIVTTNMWLMLVHPLHSMTHQWIHKATSRHPGDALPGLQLQLCSLPACSWLISPFSFLLKAVWRHRDQRRLLLEWVFFIWPTTVKGYHSSVIHHGAAEFVSVFLSFLMHFFVRIHQNGPHIIFWYLTMGFL